MRFRFSLSIASELNCRSRDYAGAEAEAVVAVVDYSKLSGSYALDGFKAFENVFAAPGTGRARKQSRRESRRVAVFETHLHGIAATGPRVACDEVHLGEVQRVAVLLVGAVALRNVNDVVVDIFAYHVPGSAAEAETLALAYGVEPVAAVLAELAARLKLDNRPRTFAEMAAYEVVVVDFTEEAYALRVLAVGVGHAALYGEFAHAALGELADREHEVAQLVVGDAGEEVGLILYRIYGRAEPHLAVALHRGGVMPRGRAVERVAPALLEVTELDDAVAHDVGVGRESAAHSVERILHHVLPVFVVKAYYIERQTVASRYEAAHLYVLLGRAVAVFTVDADVEQMQRVALFQQTVYGDSTVDAPRYEYRYIHFPDAIMVNA